MKFPRRGDPHLVGGWLGRDQIRAIYAERHVDALEKQQVMAYSVLTGEDDYGAAVLLLAFSGVVRYADSSGPSDRSEQAFLGNLGISSRSA